jgi:beta-mannosidase
MFTRYFRMPEGFESFVYLSQVQQALAIKTAVEYWRTLRPRCMGTLYWQLNDNWPVCSWSSVEYDGTWKLLHYVARRFYAPVLLCACLKDGRVEVSLVNDLPAETRCRATIAVVAFSGKVLNKESHDVRAAAGSARRVKTWALKDLAPSPDAAFLHLALERDGETTFNELFLTEPKRAPLEPARVTVEVEGTKGGFSVRLSTDAPAFYTALDAGGIAGEFSDNCMTLIPGTPCAVLFTPREKVTADRLRRGLTVRHLRDSYR